MWSWVGKGDLLAGMKGHVSILSLAAFLAVAISLSLKWLVACEANFCLQIKIHTTIFTALPRHFYKSMSPYLFTKPPRDCYLKFDEFQEEQKELARSLTFQVYDRNLTVKTRLHGPRAFQSLNVTIITIGSTGDALPVVPLASEFLSRGHRVRVATHAKFRHFFSSVPGVDFFPLDFDPELNTAYFNAQKCFMTCDLPISLLFAYHYLKMFLSFFTAVDSPDAMGVPFKSDIILATPHASGYEMVAEWLQVPVHAISFHPAAPTGHTAYAYARDFVKPWWTEEQVLMTHTMQEAMPWAFLYGPLSLIRWYKGLDPVPYSPRPKGLVPYTLLYSPSLAPHYPDWGDHIEIVGSTLPPALSNVTLPTSLLDFVADGEAPVFLGFGSMMFKNPEEITRMMVKALNVTGQRGIIQKGWAGLGSLPEGLPDSVYQLTEFVPHDVLFPLCKAAMHHGGCGTTQAALKARIPAIVVPVFTDQRYWAERVNITGVGASVPYAEFTAETLAAGIDYALREEVRERARVMGRR